MNDDKRIMRKEIGVSTKTNKKRLPGETNSYPRFKSSDLCLLAMETDIFLHLNEK